MTYVSSERAGDRLAARRLGVLSGGIPVGVPGIEVVDDGVMPPMQVRDRGRRAVAR